MKTPEVLARQLARQWENADTREARLLDPGAWPVRLPVGKPPPSVVERDPARVREHLKQWREVRVGIVHWKPIPYRSLGEPIELPELWELAGPEEWVRAARNSVVAAEYKVLRELLRSTPAVDHRLLIRKRHLWRGKPLEEIIQASRLADSLEPGCAEGRPLRALSFVGVDSKFYERHRRLVVELLDLRYDGEASRLDLEPFLNAAPGNDHWLLVVDLDGGLLPFQRLRARTSEIRTQVDFPGTHLLLVENEQVLHLLPKAKGVIAIFGAGLHLNWLDNPSFRDRPAAYWGDLDTWGLHILAEARQRLPHLQPLLMDTATFERFAPGKAVAEPNPADLPEAHLSAEEQALFTRLLALDKGRLEQEFLPAAAVHEALARWHGKLS